MHQVGDDYVALKLLIPKRSRPVADTQTKANDSLKMMALNYRGVKSDCERK